MNEYLDRIEKIMNAIADGVIDNRSGIISLHLLAMEVCNDRNLSDEDADALICLITDRQTELGIDVDMMRNLMFWTMSGLEEILKS